MRIVSILKQLLACLVVAVVALVVWARFDPNARSVLEGNGLEAIAMIAPAGQGQGGDSPSGGRRGGFGGAGFGAPLVTVDRVTETSMDQRFETIGTGLSLHSVMLRPKETGQVAEIAVSTGDRIERGDLILQLESDAQALAVERAQLALDQAADKVERYDRLNNRGTISTVEADQARADLATARVALKEAELALQRRKVEAPISGVIGIVGVDPGELLTTTTDIATIEDYSSLLVTFYVPERLASYMNVGADFSAQTEAVPNATFEGEIVGIDNRLEEASRTLRVRGRIPNDSGSLRPGMSFSIGFDLEGSRQLSVPPLAVQWGNDGAYVWRLDEQEKVARTAISVIQRNADRVLVTGNGLSVGSMVVKEGVESVREGGEVRIDNELASEGRPTASIGDEAGVSANP